MTDENRIFKCSFEHVADWLITYDIGNDRTEKMLVCNGCYSNPDDPSFRLYVISKESVNPETNLLIET